MPRDGYSIRRILSPKYEGVTFDASGREGSPSPRQLAHGTQMGMALVLCDRGGRRLSFLPGIGTDRGLHNMSQGIHDSSRIFHGGVRSWSRPVLVRRQGWLVRLEKKVRKDGAGPRECHGSQRTEGDGTSDPFFSN